MQKVNFLKNKDRKMLILLIYKFLKMEKDIFILPVLLIIIQRKKKIHTLQISEYLCHYAKN
ncbi:TPA: hypothetical protein MI508_27730 [Klebsiella pneumoniae]|nr:hypothetical protein [Klebsiella pneumoniae]